MSSHSKLSTCKISCYRTSLGPLPGVYALWGLGDYGPWVKQLTACFSLAHKLRVTFMFLNGQKNSKEKWYLACENYMKFIFQFSINFYWNTAKLMCVCRYFHSLMAVVTKVVWPTTPKAFTVWWKNLQTPELDQRIFAFLLRITSWLRPLNSLQVHLGQQGIHWASCG